jgi:GPH family glycoside/pentoside/hexuronide:cation symporter
MSAEGTRRAHWETAPEDRIPFVHKLFYGAGAFVNNILAAAIGGMTIVLNLGLGMNDSPTPSPTP